MLELRDAGARFGKSADFVYRAGELRARYGRRSPLRQEWASAGLDV